MAVVADTSPPNYLVLIGEDRLLAELYGKVIIPGAVLQELQHPKAPLAVRRWLSGGPAWLFVQSEIPPFVRDVSRARPRRV
jgi:hypothetical protein